MNTVRKQPVTVRNTESALEREKKALENKNRRENNMMSTLKKVTTEEENPSSLLDCCLGGKNKSKAKSGMQADIVERFVKDMERQELQEKRVINDDRNGIIYISPEI